MDFEPDGIHLALQQMAGDFARQEILPLTEEIDRGKDPAGRFPAALLEKGSRLGLRTLAVPEALGGGGADLLTLCFVAEELGWGDLGIAATFAQDWSVTYALGFICGRERFGEFLSAFVRDHSVHLARGTMSSRPAPEERAPYEADGNDVPVRVMREAGGEWRVSGIARHVMNGAAARHILLSVTPPAGEDRMAFLVDAAATGPIPVLRNYDSMGMRSCQDVDLEFENLALAEESRIVCEPAAWSRSVPAFCILPASAALGTARRANELATAHARERVQGGRSIIEHQTVGFILCESQMELNAARRALQAAAWAADRNATPDLLESYLTRVFVAEACERIARRSMEVWGGAGYMTEAPMERFVRDTVSFAHADEMTNSLRARAMALI